MRSMIISFFCLGLLVLAWGIYNNYSDDRLHGYISTLENSIIKNVESEKWKPAYDDFDRLAKNWRGYKKYASVFFDSDDINETDYSIARARRFIMAEDVSNASGELSYLKEQFAFFLINDSLSLENIL